MGTTAPTTGFSFGQTTTAGTGLFGAKPATTGFGTTGFGTTGSTFGAATSGASMFNKPATSAFSFGGESMYIWKCRTVLGSNFGMFIAEGLGHGPRWP